MAKIIAALVARLCHSAHAERKLQECQECGLYVFIITSTHAHLSLFGEPRCGRVFRTICRRTRAKASSTPTSSRWVSSVSSGLHRVVTGGEAALSGGWGNTYRHTRFVNSNSISTKTQNKKN